MIDKLRLRINALEKKLGFLWRILVKASVRIIDQMEGNC